MKTPILLLTALDLLLRRGASTETNATQRKALLLPTALLLALIGLGSLAYSLLRG